MGDAVWIKMLKTPHSSDVHVGNRRFMRKSSCRRSSLALSTVRLWNRSTVSNSRAQRGRTSVQTFMSSPTILLCSLLGCGCRVVFSLARLSEQLDRLGPPTPTYPRAHPISQKAAVRSATAKTSSGGVSRSGLCHAAKPPPSETSTSPPRLQQG